MAMTTKKRSVKIYLRENDEIVSKTYNDIMTEFNHEYIPDSSVSDFKNAITSMISEVSKDTYINADIIDTFDLNEEAAKEEDNNG